MSIANYIREDLAARLTSGQELPAALTLDSLAEYYQVSFTPVRTAVAELIDKGLIRKGPNRRLTPCRRPTAGAQTAAVAPLPQPPRDPYEVIANDLVRLSLEGKAVYLREEATAKQYDISRSAVRNILHRLAGSGMLDHIPRRGWRLRPFRQDDLQAFIEVREVLELKALELARAHLVEADLLGMLNANVVPQSKAEPARVDESLHRYLIEKADNSYIRDFFERQGRYFDVLFRWEDHDRQAAVETVRQHRDILQALLRKDWPAARTALSYHIRCNHPILSKIVPATSNTHSNKTEHDDTTPRRSR